MSVHQTTEEAKQLGLAGSDTFRETHICYVDEANCKGTAIRLYHEAVTAFGWAYDIKHRQKLAQEADSTQAWFENGGFTSSEPLPSAPLTHTSLGHMNFNHLLISYGFELTLKGILLEQGFIIQLICHKGPFKNLAKKTRI